MPTPFIPAPNCATVELIYGVAGVVIENVFAVQYSEPFTFTQLQDLRNNVDHWDDAGWKGARNPAVTLDRIRSRALDDPGAPVEDYYLPAPRAGTFTGQLTSLNATFSIKLATGLAGRSQRGRLYVPGINTNQYSTSVNEILLTSANAYVALLNLLISDLAGAGYRLGVISRRHNKAWRPAAKFTPATEYVAVDLHIDSQRRRLTGRGI